MPSANITPAVNAMNANVDIMDYINHPMKPALTIVEHKIRNLEKRKGKLDQYKAEQDAGKELNADQLAAVAKYGEVIQQLELARDLIKQIGQANDETRREIKKHRKAEAVERSMQETEKLRTLFLFQLVISELETGGDIGNECGENSDLKNAVHVIKKHQFVRCSELLKMCDPNVHQSVDMLASNWVQVLDGSKKLVDSQSKERVTFKNIRDNLLAVANSDYFTNKRHNEPAAVEREEHVNEENNISDSESIPSSATNANSIPQVLHRIEPSVTISAPVTHQQVPSPTVCHVQDSAYQFLQDSQIDLGSPHFDPAVVAVSSSPPALPHGPINTHFDHHQVRNARNAFTISTPAPQQLGVSMSDAMGDRVVPDYVQQQQPIIPVVQPIMPLIDDKITEWNASDAHQNGNHQDDRNGSDDNDGGTYNNRFGSNNRGRGGGGRGFRRGSSNGFAHRGNSRGGRPSTGYSRPENTNRIGYFRSDQQNQQQDHSFESREFRPTSRGSSGAGGTGTVGNTGGRNAREPGTGNVGNIGSRNVRESGSGSGNSYNGGNRNAREPGAGYVGNRREPGTGNAANGPIGGGRNSRPEGGGGYGGGQRQRGGGSGGVPQGHGQGGNYGGVGEPYRGGAGARGGNNKPVAPRSSETNANGHMANCY